MYDVTISDPGFLRMQPALAHSFFGLTFWQTMTEKKNNTNNNLKPGQKFPTPTPGFGDRVFYETLLRQRPNSTMAQEWYEIE
jgi:hypothetical protein